MFAHTFHLNTEHLYLFRIIWCFVYKSPPPLPSPITRHWRMPSIYQDRGIPSVKGILCLQYDSEHSSRIVEKTRPLCRAARPPAYRIESYVSAQPRTPPTRPRVAELIKEYASGRYATCRNSKRLAGRSSR